MVDNANKRLSDFVGFGEFGTNVGVSSGNRFASSQRWTRQFSYTYGWRSQEHVRELADVNGDGKADIVGFGNGGIVVALSTGSGFAAEQVSRDATVLNFNPDKERRLIGDVTGDGREDIVMIKANGVYVLVANDNGGYEK